jgi:geranylgeranyl diphosphate synthase, type II
MNSSDYWELREAFTDYLPLPARLEANLEDALRHILRNTGSLFRPQIVLSIAQTYDIPRSHAKELAIALEYFHTASLVFDDLPCMDDAVERRGAPCAHLQFGESGAILAALAIINRAYALTWQAVAACPADRQTRGLAYLEERLGVGGLLNGQSLDLRYSTLPHDLRTTERVAVGKTVSLFQLTLVLPAVLGGAPESEIRLLERIGRFWGLSYQVVDDLKDVLQSSEESGKTVARDLSLERPNIALAIGISAATARLSRLIDLGDKTLRRLVARRPSLHFLGKLRQSLQEETARVVQSACTCPMRSGA